MAELWNEDERQKLKLDMDVIVGDITHYVDLKHKSWKNVFTETIRQGKKHIQVGTRCKGKFASVDLEEMFPEEIFVCSFLLTIGNSGKVGRKGKEDQDWLQKWEKSLAMDGRVGI